MDAARSRALLHGEVAAAMDAPQFPPSHWTASSCQVPPSPLTDRQLGSIVGLCTTCATIRPAHARLPHPTWATAVRQIIR